MACLFFGLVQERHPTQVTQCAHVLWCLACLAQQLSSYPLGCRARLLERLLPPNDCRCLGTNSLCSLPKLLLQQPETSSIFHINRLILIPLIFAQFPRRLHNSSITLKQPRSSLILNVDPSHLSRTSF